jgi:hypothetical protein
VLTGEIPEGIDVDTSLNGVGVTGALDRIAVFRAIRIRSESTGTNCDKLYLRGAQKKGEG